MMVESVNASRIVCWTSVSVFKSTEAVASSYERLRPRPCTVSQRRAKDAIRKLDGTHHEQHHRLLEEHSCQADELDRPRAQIRPLLEHLMLEQLVIAPEVLSGQFTFAILPACWQRILRALLGKGLIDATVDELGVDGAARAFGSLRGFVSFGSPVGAA